MLQIQAIGYLGKDAIISNKNGKSVINFSIAHTEKFKKSDGTEVEQTTWINCSIWERENLALHLKKGTMVFIQGTINLRIYEDKNHQRQVDLSCMVKDLKLLKKANDNSVENTNKHQEMPTPNTEFVDEGIF